MSGDDSQLTHTREVAASLWAGAGQLLLQTFGPSPVGLRLGDVYVSIAGVLEAKYLFHSVVVDLRSASGLTSADAEGLFANVIRLARDKSCRSLVIPPLAEAGDVLGDEAIWAAAASAINSEAQLAGDLREVILTVPVESSVAATQVLASHLIQRPTLETMVSILAETAPASKEALMARYASLGADCNPPLGAFELFSATLQAMEESLTAPAYAEATGDGRRRTLGEAYERVGALLRGGGLPLPARAAWAVGDAIRMRNEFAHGSPDSVRDAGEAAIRAIDALLTHALRQRLMDRGNWPHGARDCVEKTPLALLEAASELPHASLTEDHPESPAPPYVTGVAQGVVPSMPTGEISCPPPSHKRRSAAPRYGAGGSDQDALVHDGVLHVRTLCDFLLSTIDGSALSDLILKLRAQGYRGRDDGAVLLEYCVRVPHPIDLLSHLRLGEVQAAYRELVGGTPPENMRPLELQQAILERFGFPAERTVFGLSTLRTHLHQARREAHGLELRALKGTVLEAATWIERTIQTLLRFVCHLVYRESEFEFFLRNAKIRTARELEAKSLGALFDLLEYLANRISADDTLAIDEDFHRDLRRRRIIAHERSRVPELRNRFAHFDRESMPSSLEDARRQALAFFDEAEAFAEYLAEEESRVFPHVICIRGVRVDSYGRRTVEADNDDGSKEWLFTSANLRPGEVYLKYPRTNPFRIDPILLPAGNLGRPSARRSTSAGAPRRNSP